jgi:hypothetical protein
VAAECGLIPVSDPFSSTDDTFLQLRNLLNSAGQELVELFPWQYMIKEYSFTTLGTDSGKYDLPPDFGYMIDQTHWDRTNDVALSGPLTPQDWTYLIGRNLVSSTIYASFRQVEGQFWLFPQPPPDGLEIAFEYMSINWVADSQSPGSFRDTVESGADVVLFVPVLMIKLLKQKFLTAKGFDSTAAAADFRQALETATGRDKGSQLLNAGRNVRSYPYLDYRNTPDSGYGL